MSLILDRGSEMADHKTFSLATGIKVYFCDPQRPSQRSSNENTNALLRQHLPKGMDLPNVPKNRLNERSGNPLSYCSPVERSSGCVAATD
jgi:IS30 family transposase